jgi:hypothetical protein
MMIGDPEMDCSQLKPTVDGDEEETLENTTTRRKKFAYKPRHAEIYFKNLEASLTKYQKLKSKLRAEKRNIDRLDRQMKQMLKQIQKREPEQLNCVVCFEYIQPQEKVAFRRSCQHMVHSQCLTEWMEYLHNCPVCMKVIDDVPQVSTAAAVNISEAFVNFIMP